MKTITNIILHSLIIANLAIGYFFQIDIGVIVANVLLTILTIYYSLPILGTIFFNKEKINEIIKKSIESPDYNGTYILLFSPLIGFFSLHLIATPYLIYMTAMYLFFFTTSYFISYILLYNYKKSQ